MILTAIVAVDKNFGIGKDGQLLADLPTDLAHFKKVTQGGILIMGRKTAMSLPGGKPLPNRTNIVLTRDGEYIERFFNLGFHVVGDLDKAILRAEDLRYDYFINAHSNTKLTDKDIKESPVFIIGGEQIYNLFFPICDRCIITHIDAQLEADTFFPKIDGKLWKIMEKSPIIEDNYNYQVITYERVGSV